MFSSLYYDKQASYLESLDNALEVANDQQEPHLLDSQEKLRICSKCSKPQLNFLPQKDDESFPGSSQVLDFNESYLSNDNDVTADDVKPKGSNQGTYVTALMNTLLTTRSPTLRHLDRSLFEGDFEISDLNQSERYEAHTPLSHRQHFKRRPSMQAEQSSLVSSVAKSVAWRLHGPKSNSLKSRSFHSGDNHRDANFDSSFQGTKKEFDTKVSNHNLVKSVGVGNETPIEMTKVDPNLKNSHGFIRKDCSSAHDIYYSLSPVVDQSASSVSDHVIDSESNLDDWDDVSECSSSATTSSVGGAGFKKPEYFAVLSKTQRRNRDRSRDRSMSIGTSFGRHSDSFQATHSYVMSGVLRDRTNNHQAIEQAEMKPQNDQQTVSRSVKAENRAEVTSAHVFATPKASSNRTAGRHWESFHGDNGNSLQNTPGPHEPGLLSFSNVFDIGDVPGCDVTENYGDVDFIKDGYCQCSFCIQNEDMFTSTQGREDDEMKISNAHCRTPYCKNKSRSTPSPIANCDPPLLLDDLNSTPSDHEEKVENFKKSSPEYRAIINLFCQCEKKPSVETEALEKGVEKHSTGVSSVLNLCEVLLHDNDACGDENDKVSLQDATKSLDRRWRNICALSMDRRLKIEDTQKLWQKFLSDFAQFSEWLNTCEETAKTSNTEKLTHEDTRKVLRVQENFQRKVHEGLIQLELINKQYRRLARENRTDASSQIKQMILFGNSRWDTISRRVSETIRRLKHAIDRRENFECLRESLLVWLTESDLQLTNLELFSTSLSKKEKLDKIKVFESKIEEMIPKMKNLDAEGKALVEEGEGEDVATVEEEMNDFHKYCSDMVSRLEKFYHKIIREEGNDAQSSAPNLLEDSEMKNFSWYTARCMSSPSSTSTPSNKLTSLKKVGGRSTPQMVGGLEWDHNYDISQNELEANVLDGLTDDDSIPELSPFETRDEMSKHVKSHGITSPVAVKRSNADDVDALESEQIPGLARKKRRWMTGNNQDQQKQQLKSDVTTLLEWLATMETPTLPKSGDVTIDVIEKKLNQIKNLQKEAENRKPIFVSIKLVSSRFAREDKGDSDVTGQVEELSKKWGKLVDEVKSDKEDLLRCFIKSKELKSSLSEVMTLIDTKDGERSDLLSLLKSHNSPVPMSLRELRKIHKSMIQIRLDSLEARSQVASLQEISNELISSEASPRTSSVVGAAETCKRLANLSGRLKTFLNQIKEDIRLAEVSLEQERSRMRSEVSSNSDLESIASEASLYSSPSLKLKILRRKEDSTSSMESFDGRKTRPTNPNLITTTLTSSSNSMTSSSTKSTSSYLKPESDNNSSTNITQNTLVLHNSSTKDIRIADSDGESGYVEFEPEFELLKAALTHVRTTETQKTVTVKDRDSSTTTKTNLIIEEIDSESTNNYFPVLAFLTRCFLAALPFYFLILFILLPIIFPMDCYTETSACLRRNNLYSSVYPSLAWADGPPPT